MSFWGELKRRNVFKVGAVYVIVAWVILQAISIIFPLLHLPSWTGTFVTVLIIIGFPVTLIIAWAFELTADGVKRTSEVPENESIPHVTGRKINYVLGGLLVMAVALLIFDNYYLDRRVVKPEVASPVAEQTSTTAEVEESPKTIAVLPFADMSPEKDQEYFVDGLSEEILNSLAQISNLNVTGRTSSFTFKGSDKKVQEIADELGVDHILEGSVRKSGNALRITAQLLRGADGFHLWSKTYDRELKDIFAVQEDIAIAVADELKVTLGIGHSFRQVGGTDDVRAYEIYLVAQGLWNGRASEGDLPKATAHAIEIIDVALETDPNFSLAWASKAIFHTFYIVVGPANQVTTSRDEALRAASRAIELEPNLAAGYYALGFFETTIGNYAEAEMAYRKALELSNEMLWFNVPAIALQCTTAGYFEKAHTFLAKTLENDPLNDEVRGFYYLNSAFLSDPEKAEEEYNRGRELIGNKWLWGNWFRTFIHLGSNLPISRDEILGSFLDHYEPADHLYSSEEGLAELHRLLNNDPNISVRSLMEFGWWASYFGDPEFAMNILEKAFSVDLGSFFAMWLPVMHDVRQLPRFKELVREIGLVDYWEQFGWPDLCRPTDDGDFVCD